MYQGKPVIGIVGGVGSGKSFVARLFGELGCLVLDSDEHVGRVYQRDDIKRTLVEWWGSGVLTANGQVDRTAIAQIIFKNPAERQRLERLVHPLVGQIRDEQMVAADRAQVVAYVWDTPLLFEAGLDGQTDAVVFVDAPLPVRAERVAERGWDAAELSRREKNQLPLDKKREMSDHIVNNTASADGVRTQVREVLSRILADTSKGGR